MIQRDADGSLLSTGIDRPVLPAPWLKGAVAAISFSIALTLCCMVSNSVGPLEATNRLEQIAGRLERANAIHPETARAIIRLMGNTGYDCSQATCSAELQTRNSAVRQRLMTLIAGKVPANMLAGFHR